MEGRTAFVTGATGLLGGNVTRELVRHGWRVRALVRSPEKAQRLLGDLDVELVTQDLANVDAYADSLEGVDTVFHTAAYFREYYQPGNQWETMKQINVDATMGLLKAAEKRGVRRVVHTSSSGVIETRTANGDSADESAPFSSFAEENLYFKTKVLVEQEIAGFLESSHLDVVLILPGWMIGPGDAGPTSAGQLILDLMKGKLPGVVDGGTSAVDARDVAQAMITAADKGRRGERYLVAGSLTTLVQIAHTLEEVTGTPMPKRVIPRPIAMIIAHLSDFTARITGGVSKMPVAGIKTLSERVTLSSDKAKRELGVAFRPLSETLTDAVAWYRQHGYLAEAQPGG